MITPEELNKIKFGQVFRCDDKEVIQQLIVGVVGHHQKEVDE